MAFVVDPKWTASILMQDQAGNHAHTTTCIKVGDGFATEAEARSLVLSLASAIQSISNAGVQSTVLRAQSDDLTGSPSGDGSAYEDVDDAGRVKIQPVTGDRAIPILLPAPKPVIFLPDRQTIDRANTAVGNLFTWIATKAVNYAGERLIDWVSGQRERAPGKALPPGVPLLPAA